MKRTILDPKFSAEMNRMAMRYMRAIRVFDILNAHLPIKVPAPSDVKLGKRPYALEIVWKRRGLAGATDVRDKLDRVLDLTSKWHSDPDSDTKTLVCRTQLHVGEKDTVKVILKITVGVDDD